MVSAIERRADTGRAVSAAVQRRSFQPDAFFRGARTSHPRADSRHRRSRARCHHREPAHVVTQGSCQRRRASDRRPRRRASRRRNRRGLGGTRVRPHIGAWKRPGGRLGLVAVDWWCRRRRSGRNYGASWHCRSPRHPFERAVLLREVPRVVHQHRGTRCSARHGAERPAPGPSSPASSRDHRGRVPRLPQGAQGPKRLLCAKDENS